MKRKPYRITDAAAARITSKIHKEFRHNRLALFDELNIAGVKKHVHKLYKSIYKTVKQEFLRVANEIYQARYLKNKLISLIGCLFYWEEICEKSTCYNCRNNNDESA